jgi:hypothetical protein
LAVKTRLFRRAALALVVLALAGGAVARAQEPAKTRAFVYGINAALGNTYSGSFVPPSVPGIYLLADQTSVISPRMTEIYFWPITNEYKASFETVNEPVAGSLEIIQGGQVIKSTEPTSYTIHYKPRGAEVDAALFLGKEADQAQASFTAEQKAYQQALSDFYKQQQAWLALADDANQRIAKGEKVTIPPAPQQPQPISVTSNGINQGIPIKLPVGVYQIRLRDPKGAIVPDSTRALVVFSPRRTGIGYQVVPETRWTTPDQADDQTDVIVGKANSQLYLIPHTAREFPARAYALLQDPQQQVGETSDWTWVLGEPVTTGQLEVSGAGAAPERRELTPYRVKQSPGNTLGYQIEPFTPDPSQPAAPDLVAYPIHIDQPGSGYEIRLLSPQGEPVPGSTRLVRTPAAAPLATLLVLALVPLAVGALVLVRRRMRMRMPRNFAG